MMKRRQSQSPYFKRIYSFDSPECSSVIQINPTCQSQESMLQKIIFPNNFQRQRIFQQNNQYEQYQSKNRPQLKEKNLYSNKFNTMPLNFNSNKKNLQQNQKKSSYISNKQDLNGQQKYNSKQRPTKQSIQKKYRYISNKQNVQIYDIPKKTSPSVIAKNQKYKCGNTQKQSYYETTSANKDSLNKKYNSIENLYSNSCRAYSQSVQLKRSEKDIYDQEYQYKNFTTNNMLNSHSTIDLEKLRKIQQKIKNYTHKKSFSFERKNNQMKDNEFNKYPRIPLQSKNYPQKRNIYQVKRQDLSYQDIYRAKGVNLKIQNPKRKIANFEDISFEKANIESLYERKIRSKDNNYQRKKKVQSHLGQVLQKYLQQIYDIVRQDTSYQLCSNNCNLSNLKTQQIKLILGSIFSQIKIRNKIYTKKEFISSSLNILSSYQNQEIQKILVIMKASKKYSQCSYESHKPNDSCSEKDKKILNARKIPQKKYLKEIPYQNQVKQNQENFCSYQRQRKDRQNQNKFVSKFAYIKPESDQFYNPTIGHFPQRKLKGFQGPLQHMFISQDQKRMPLQIQKQSLFQKDQQLKRLQNLQEKFSQFFSHKKQPNS